MSGMSVQRTGAELHYMTEILGWISSSRKVVAVKFKGTFLISIPQLAVTNRQLRDPLEFSTWWHETDDVLCFVAMKQQQETTTTRKPQWLMYHTHKFWLCSQSLMQLIPLCHRASLLFKNFSDLNSCTEGHFPSFLEYGHCGLLWVDQTSTTLLQLTSKHCVAETLTETNMLTSQARTCPSPKLMC